MITEEYNISALSVQVIFPYKISPSLKSMVAIKAVLSSPSLCTSTGDPVTTVTWIIDSQTVSGEIVSVLDDRVTAQYTHSLNTGRLGEEYLCIVTNNKPSQDTTSLKIEGSYPKYCAQLSDHESFNNCKHW